MPPALSSAGDINGDGFDDLLIGSQYIDDQYGSLMVFRYRGPAYVVFGKAESFGTSLDVSTAQTVSNSQVLTTENSPDRFPVEATLTATDSTI